MIEIKKVIYIRKTVFVREGGRNYRYSSYSIVSNGKNKIGFYNSKAKNLSDATFNSFISAKKRMFKFNIKKNTLPYAHDFVTSKTKIVMKPSNKKIGIIAGGKIRKILLNTGIKNIICKIYGSKNKFNVIKTVEKMLFYFKK
ncbi:30S ribosomal protein S5 [Candidatus Vidania fulgoroideorum]